MEFAASVTYRHDSCAYGPVRTTGSTIRGRARMLIALALVWLPAQAQLTLPQVPVPPVQLPVDLGKTASSVTSQLDPERLRSVRLLRMQDLLRKHRDTFEADPKAR